MRIPRKIRLWLLLGGVILIGILWGYLAVSEQQRKHFEGAVPAALELTDAVFIHEELTSCGVAIFRLSKATIARINSDGKSLLEGATKARVPHEYPGEWYSTYQNWKPTPVPASWSSEGTWIICFYDHEVVRNITAAGKAPGSYYTANDGGRAKLILVPSLGLIAYSFYD
jgi:hypothetical protein